jgi:hypothetical protein
MAPFIDKTLYPDPVFSGYSDELYAQPCQRRIRGLLDPCHPADNIHDLQIIWKPDAQCKFGIDRQYGFGHDKDAVASDIHYIAAQKVSIAAEGDSHADFYANSFSVFYHLSTSFKVIMKNMVNSLFNELTVLRTLSPPAVSYFLTGLFSQPFLRAAEYCLNRCHTFFPLSWLCSPGLHRQTQ